MNELYEASAVAEMIIAGKRLLLAGDEALLAALPKGDWIGGTIPYFMTSEGGLQTAKRVFVTEIPHGATTAIKTYDTSSLPDLAADHPGNGFTFLLLPAFSAVHLDFAKNVAHYTGVFERPLVGWVTGVAVDDIGRVQPKVFDGAFGRASSELAVAMHVELPAHQQASVDIINLFRPGDGDIISFTEGGFSVTEVLINGAQTNFARYLIDGAVDTQLPLIADYNGAMVNVCIRDVDAVSGTVSFYAPVFAGVSYRMAAPIGDYVSSFAAQLHGDLPAPVFSCNCILNYLYADLAGRTTAPLTGPVTFGEIAYMLLNQTAVYLTVRDVD